MKSSQFSFSRQDQIIYQDNQFKIKSLEKTPVVEYLYL